MADAHDEELKAAKDYASSYYGDAGIEGDFDRLAKYQPDVVKGYMTLRSGIFREPPEGALSAKDKELVILGIEVSNKKVNPPPEWHARKAIESGATVEEVAEVVSLAIMLGGMMTFRESGRFVLAAAEKRAQELAEEGK